MGWLTALLGVLAVVGTIVGAFIGYYLPDRAGRRRNVAEALAQIVGLTLEALIVMGQDEAARAMGRDADPIRDRLPNEMMVAQARVRFLDPPLADALTPAFEKLIDAMKTTIEVQMTEPDLAKRQAQQMAAISAIKTFEDDVLPELERPWWKPRMTPQPRAEAAGPDAPAS